MSGKNLKQRPKTYFLQEAIDRGLAAIAARLDPEQDNLPFFWLNLFPEPYLEHRFWDWGDMGGRYVDAYILGRQVTGNDQHQDAEVSLRRLLPACDPYKHPFMAGRILIAYVDEYLQEPTPEHQKQVDELVKLIRSKTTFEKDYAYFIKAPEGWSSMADSFPPSLKPSQYPTGGIGGPMLALARYLEEVDNPEFLDLLARWCRFFLYHSGIIDKEGRFMGATHSGEIFTAAIGTLRYALLVKNSEMIEHIQHLFDWTIKQSSSWGWVSDWLGKEPSACETCSIMDALHLGLLLARSVAPSYFDVVERYARNQLLENQFLKPDMVIPKGNFPQRKRVAKALYGSWASMSLPNSLDNCFIEYRGHTGVEGCCLGAGIRACFLVWDNVVRKKGDTVWVNLAFSRNSPWIEVISYQPYVGRLDLLVHDAPKLRVRLPVWVAERDIQVSVRDKLLPVKISPQHYLELDGLKKDDYLKIEYPLRREKITEAVLAFHGEEYKVRWRGDSVVNIEPQGEKYPLYEREWMEQDSAPLLPDQPYQAQKGGPVFW